MFRLLYLSRSLIPPASPDMLAIAQVSMARNSISGVTGFLYYDDETFLQALEGLAEDVDRIYDSIRRDRRHADVVTLARTPIEARVFGAWTMGFHDGTTEGGRLTDALGPRFRDRAGPGDSEAALRFLRDLSVGRLAFEPVGASGAGV